MAQPEGFIKVGKEDYVLRLKKALYRLKQAPRAWNYKLDYTLNSMGFKKKILVNMQCVSQVSKNTNDWWESM